jgi:hypothetical protein
MGLDHEADVERIMSAMDIGFPQPVSFASLWERLVVQSGHSTKSARRATTEVSVRQVHVWSAPEIGSSIYECTPWRAGPGLEVELSVRDSQINGQMIKTANGEFDFATSQAVSGSTDYSID